MKYQPFDADCKSVYLCQTGPEVSCGACCGLYNVVDPSLEALEAMLVRRTHWFAGVPRTVAGIDAFKARVENAECPDRPFPDFHHCPYLGMIEDEGRRVGCLLHPLAAGNNGIDWRGLSYYGGMACRSYFCPSVKQLPSRWLAALRQSMAHWHLHGLIVTERRLLTAFFEILESRLARPVHPDDFTAGSQAAALLSTFAGLKLAWPFRQANALGMTNYFFEDGLYPRPAVHRANAAIPPSPFEAIFRELDSGFSSIEEQREAERKISGIIDGIVGVVRK
ncbi:hypothetical protein Dvar_19220 [Desulfosarcina variabilis str. Montpellier]|uniref:hypothetical protein n=1 Tax=Desulfosarcina variabilis TaxID=2300 RepID=UPI003AFB1C87